jgi:hypothetical protein
MNDYFIQHLKNLTLQRLFQRLLVWDYLLVQTAFLLLLNFRRSIYDMVETFVSMGCTCWLIYVYKRKTLMPWNQEQPAPIRRIDEQILVIYN